MKNSYQVIKKDRSNIINGFLNACATIIQKCFRGYLVRKYIVAEIMEELRAQNRALDMLKKWQMGNNLMYCN
jgi:IQ calmodulin-binding motif